MLLFIDDLWWFDEIAAVNDDQLELELDLEVGLPSSRSFSNFLYGTDDDLNMMMLSLERLLIN